MSIFRSEKTVGDGEGARSLGGHGARRAGRLVARVVLWGCVLLLLVRGLVSEFASPGTRASASHAVVAGRR
jgi:hypothetical protein